MLIFVDSTTLVNLAKAGGSNALDELLVGGNEVIITDAVFYEAVTKGGANGYPDANIIQDWLSQNNIPSTPTEVFQQFEQNGGSDKGLGERSIAEEISSPTYFNSSYEILSDNIKDYQKFINAGASPSDISGTVDFLNQQFADNKISGVDYASIRDGLKRIVDPNTGETTVANVDGVLDDSTLGVTPWRNTSTNNTSTGNIEYFPAGETPVGAQYQAINLVADAPAAGTSSVDAAQQGGEALWNKISAEGMPEGGGLSFRNVMGPGEALGALGAGAMAYDGYQSAVTAMQYADNGDYANAAKTMNDYAARLDLSFVGAEAGIYAGLAFGPYSVVASPILAFLGGVAGLFGYDVLQGMTPAQAAQQIANGFLQLLDVVAKEAIIVGLTTIDPRFLTSGYAVELAGLLNKSMIHRDPLVVDLTGAGLKLTSLANSAAEFDYGATGLDTPTGWMGAGAGMLVLPNANGQVVNGQQLFGPATGNGFTELAALDSNHDGIINSSDAQFTSLEIWQDTNGDGVEQSGELETLTQAGIKSISLGTTSVNQTNAGNQVQATAIVTFTNNNTTTISEVNFAVDTLNTTINSAAPPSYTLTSAIEALPTVKGYGQMYDLDIAMALDGTLQTDVTNLTNVSAGDFTDFESDVTTSLYEWAGVACVNSNNRTVANDNFCCNLKISVAA